MNQYVYNSFSTILVRRVAFPLVIVIENLICRKNTEHQVGNERTVHVDINVVLL